MVTGGVIGWKAGNKVKRYIVPPATLPDAYAIHAVGGAPLLRKMRRERNIKHTISSFIISPGLVYGGMTIGGKVGARLAILYIARKYGLDFHTAAKEIANDLGKLKK